MSHKFGQGHPFRILRPAILKRARWKCAYCGKRGSTVDHVIPVSRGGNHHSDNMVCACAPCNVDKNDMTLAEWIATGNAPEGANTLMEQRKKAGLPC